MPSAPPIAFEPIGTVRNAYPQGHKPLTWQGTESKIEIDPRWAEGLIGLEGYSHLSVICHLDLFQGQEPVMQIRAQRRPEMPLVGFFCTRTPLRPNPISLTTVELIERKGNILRVRNLDMYDGTRVLDIKPYLPRGDSQPGATVPEWMRRLWAIHDAERKTV
jgi:tRNA-Thr(GGU) m(6)t(6)A37 methyltransferase TsaA